MATTAPIVSTEQSPKVKLYWLEQSRSQRILWLLQELNVPYELEIFHRDPKPPHLAGPELKKVHALGKSPVISFTPAGSTESVVVAESGFIVEYLLDHYGSNSKLLPKRYKDGQEGKIGGETEEYLRFKYFLYYAEGSLMTLMIVALVTLNIVNAPVPFFVKPILKMVGKGVHTTFLDDNFKTHYTFLEEQIRTSPGGEKKYLCGPNLTGADILLSFPLIAGKDRSGLTKEAYPLLAAYVDRLEAEPGYLKAVDKIKEIEGKFETTI